MQHDANNAKKCNLCNNRLMYECMGPFKKKILYQKVYYNCVLFVTADEENEKKN